MPEHVNIEYQTRRLRVDPWTAYSAERVEAVQHVMTSAVTASLPPPWRGHYDPERAQRWIAERDAEGPTLLVREHGGGRTVGLVVLYCETEVDWRLGYMLCESAWGQGFASELVQGLVQWAARNGVRTLTGGVAADNPASSRVLEKAGFTALPPAAEGDEVLYRCVFSA